MDRYYVTQHNVPVEVDLVYSFGFKKYIIYEPGNPGIFYRIEKIPRQWSKIEKEVFDEYISDIKESD